MFIGDYSTQIHPVKQFIIDECVTLEPEQNMLFLEFTQHLLSVPLLVHPHNNGINRLTSYRHILGYGAVLEEIVRPR